MNIIVKDNKFNRLLFKINYSNDTIIFSFFLGTTTSLSNFTILYIVCFSPLTNFSFENNMIYLGDIIISYDTLLKEVKSKKIDFKDHLSHILIHGILHLKGYTHDKEEDTRLMQNEEKRLLKNLNIKNPYKI